MRQRRNIVTVSNTTARKTDTQKNRTGTGHRKYRVEIVTKLTTARKNGTGHLQDRDKRATTVTTACNISAC